MTEAARVIVEVSRGLIPGQPDDQKRWTITAREWEDALATDDGASQLLIDALVRAYTQATAWANPNTTNWVRVEWVWL